MTSRAFSLLEMMVSMVLMLLALMVASRLVLDAQASIAHSGRRHLDMSVDQAFDQLRYDVRASSDVLFPSGAGDLWVRDRMRLWGHVSGRSVVYALENEQWLRHVYAPGDPEPAATRVMLRSVRSFRIRRSPGTGRPSIEVELVYDETPPLTARTSGGQRAAVETVTRTAGLVLTPRDLGELAPSSWW